MYKEFFMSSCPPAEKAMIGSVGRAEFRKAQALETRELIWRFAKSLAPQSVYISEPALS